MLTARAKALRVISEGLRADAGGVWGQVHRRAIRDWSLPIAIANEHLIAPAFYASLKAAAALGDLPAEVRDYLAVLHRANADRNAALRRQLVELLSNFRRAEIECMVLKGGRSFVVGLYEDPGMRMFRDLDVVVRRSSVGRAHEVLLELGYAVATTYLPEQNAVAEYTRCGDAGAVDLHVEIVDVPHLLSAAEMWERSIPVTLEGLDCRTPSPTDAMLHHLVHAQIHFRGAFYWGAIELRQLYEYAALARLGGIDWRFIAARLAAHRLRTMLESYALTAQRWLNVPWPLEAPPSRVARLHDWRCAAQVNWPKLEAWAAPWANLRAAFAAHRMGARYPQLRSAMLRRVWHVAQFLRKTTPAAFLHRFFRERY